MLAPAALIMLLAEVSTRAQQPAQPQQSVEALQQQINELNSVIADLSGQLSHLNSLDSKHREIVQEARSRSVQSYYESLVSANQNGDRLREHQQKVFAWQITAANWLLAVVMIVSLSGVAFAGYEMVSARRLIARGVLTAEQSVRTKSVKTAATANADRKSTPASQEQEKKTDAKNTTANETSSPVTAITIEPTKIHITSAVIGIIILGLSLGFLYLFLKEVYAIKIFDIGHTGGIEQSSFVDPASDGRSGQ